MHDRHRRLRMMLRVLSAFFTLQGVLWLIAPQRAASGLGMPLLDGLARSTQIGDFAAFFLAAGVFMLLGIQPGRARLLYFPAALIGGAAATRTIAWLLHGAAFAWLFIAIELSTGIFLYIAAQRLAEP